MEQQNRQLLKLCPLHVQEKTVRSLAGWNRRIGRFFLQIKSNQCKKRKNKRNIKFWFEDQIGIKVLILFGSQTGTAEELAGRLAKDFARYGKKALVMDPEEIEVEDLPKITGIRFDWKQLIFWFSRNTQTSAYSLCSNLWGRWSYR